MALLLFAAPLEAQARAALTVSARVLPAQPGRAGLEAARRLGGASAVGLGARGRVETELATVMVEAVRQPAPPPPGPSAKPAPPSAAAPSRRVTIHFLRN